MTGKGDGRNYLLCDVEVGRGITGGESGGWNEPSALCLRYCRRGRGGERRVVAGVSATCLAASRYETVGREA